MIKYNPMVLLFIISILVFAYLCYVLIRPEKF
ncbi:MAG: K(+)-transporting ATPase subunit F [Chitinophagaceae bacterium]|nr:K(+)-transporting ATPase subunit F [Chitinophagaceae bacterium]